MSVFEDRVSNTTRAIEHLHDIKFTINYLSNDRIVKLYNLINKAAKAQGLTLLPKQMTNLFQIETSYLRQNNNMVIIAMINYH